MTFTTAVEGSASLLTQLVNPAARALVLGASVGLGLTVFRVKSTSLRLFTWTMVLYAALAMPLLGRILPPLSVPALAFLSHDVAKFSPTEDGTTLAQTDAARIDTVKKKANAVAGSTSYSSLLQASDAHTHTPQAAANSIPWTLVATVVYLAVALLLLARFAVGLIFSRRLLRASVLICEPRVTFKLASRANACGLAFVPQSAESDVISVPLTIGALRSTILLPSGWRDWDDATLDAVVAHEVSHVARRDALTQRLCLLHRAIFWFSPLAWWLDRHLADLAEQASDDAVIAGGANRHDYAKTLLGFFEALHTAPGRVWWQGVSMAKAGQAEQRVERILAWRGAVAMNLRKSVAVAIIAFAIPVFYLAASVRPGNNAQYPTPPAASLGAGYSLISPIAPVATARPDLSPGPASQSVHSGTSHRKGYSYAYGYDDEQRFVIVSGNSDSLTMSGTSEDAHHVEKLRKQISGDFIWFQRDEKSYIIRDQATIDRARKLWAPQEELGKKQEELGRQQEALGKQQEELGQQMEQVHVKVPDMTAELDNLKAKLQKLGSSATMEQIGELQSEIGELQSKIGEIQSHAGEEQGKLGQRQGELGEKQGKLGEQQGELGRQQGKLAEQAARQMKELLDEAIKKGTAQPEPETGGGASL